MHNVNLTGNWVIHIENFLVSFCTDCVNTNSILKSYLKKWTGEVVQQAQHLPYTQSTWVHWSNSQSCMWSIQGPPGVIP